MVETTLDPLSISESERSSARNRTNAGYAIAAIGIGALVWYLVESPSATGVLLAVAIVSLMSAASWVHRCGNSLDHRRLKQQNIQILKRLGEIQTAIDADRIQQRRNLEQIVAALGQVAVAIEALGSQMSERERAAKVAYAKKLIAGITESIHDAPRPALPEPADLYLVGHTPADGIRISRVNRGPRNRDERGPHGSRLDS